MKPKFGNDLTNTILRQSQVVQTRMAGRAVIKVVNRCNDAKENNSLNLSECQLCQVPDAVFHLMRNTPLTTCNLSGNLLSKIPPKFALKFCLITELNVSHNKMSKLPEELGDCIELQRLDLSHNSFVNLPNVVFRLPKVKAIFVNNNYIMDLEVEEVQKAKTLEELDVRENPLTRKSHDGLGQITSVRVTLTPRELEEWEDLDI
ncbi:leucine-rich repeat protein SHOC-2-like isoform X1 [Penaeus chinensis]|uniref:leucine-rich repeat protein SHOC-2-like isoform X1 n=1 Tax=Penaeus chinensis TaxID=139456 RepID=UPI001FB5AF8C|nr:leucine-rich repeat protein SHOC-2-like isoform X1 [Penaeus chinensis]